MCLYMVIGDSPFEGLLFSLIRTDLILVGKCRHMEIKNHTVGRYFRDDLVIYSPCYVFAGMNSRCGNFMLGVIFF